MNRMPERECPTCGYVATYDMEMNLRCSYSLCEDYGEVIDPNADDAALPLSTERLTTRHRLLL